MTQNYPPNLDVNEDLEQIDRHEQVRDCKMCGRVDNDYLAGTSDHFGCKETGTQTQTHTDKILNRLFSNPLDLPRL